MAEEEGTGDQDNPWAGGPEVCMGGTPKGQMTSWAGSSQGSPWRKEKGSAIGRRANASPRAEAEAVGRGKVQPGARGGQYVGVTGGESQEHQETGVRGQDALVLQGGEGVGEAR